MVEVVVVGSSGSPPMPSPGAVVDDVEELVLPGRVVVVGLVVVVELRPRPSGEEGGGVVSVLRGSVVVVAGRRGGSVVVVTGTLAAGTSSVGGGGSGRTTRYSANVATNTADSTSVELRGRRLTGRSGPLRRPRRAARSRCPPP